MAFPASIQVGEPTVAHDRDPAAQWIGTRRITVTITDKASAAAATLADRYISDRFCRTRR